jgi:hypothetical protein
MPSHPLSLIVVFHEMAREAPRTLYTLSAAYQRGVTAADYEVLVVDAGSPSPVPGDLVASQGPNFRLLRTPPSPSPAAAVNLAARSATGAALALCIDGARMLSPGIIGGMLAGLRMFADPVVATLAWHLGPKGQNESILEGYDQAEEDRLLATVDWRADGYELFRVAALAASSAAGWFGPLNESNCLAVTRSAWEELGGLDERFVSPGGGLVNLDFYRRACSRASDLVILLGEGTFHQVHGGVATNVPPERHPWWTFHDEYVAIRGEAFAAPAREAVYVGRCPEQALPFLARSVAAAGAAATAAS